MDTSTGEFVGTGVISIRSGVPEYVVRKLARDRLIPTVLVRLGRTSVLFRVSDAPAIREAALRAGYRVETAGAVAVT